MLGHDPEILDFEFRVEPLRTQYGERTGHRALFAPGVSEPVAVVSDRYRVVQPRDILRLFAAVADRLPCSPIQRTAGMHRDAFWLLARFTSWGYGAGEHYTSLLLRTSVGGRFATQAAWVYTRLQCENQFSWALKDGASIRHTTEVTAELLADKLDLDGFEAYQVSFATHMAVLRDQDELPDFVDQLALGPRVRARFDTAYAVERDNTRHGQFQAVTRMVDHAPATTRNASRALFGPSHALKERALALLLEAA